MSSESVRDNPEDTDDAGESGGYRANTDSSPEQTDNHARQAVRTHVIVWIALLCLLLLSIASAYVELGVGNWLIHYTIASAMAALLMIWFMHPRTSNAASRLVAIAGFFWLSFLFTLSLVDYLTRN